jgi:hypothetical protein
MGPLGRPAGHALALKLFISLRKVARISLIKKSGKRIVKANVAFLRSDTPYLHPEDYAARFDGEYIAVFLDGDFLM